MPDLTKVEDESVITSMIYSWRFAILGIIIANTTATILYEKYLSKFIIAFIETKFPNLIYSGVSSLVLNKNAKFIVDENHSLKFD